VLAEPLKGGPKEDDGWWDNLLNSYRRWNSHELAGVEVSATIAGQTFERASDEEGYAWFEVELADPLDDAYWQVVKLQVPAGEDHPAVSAECGVIRPGRTASLGIISDMDDTVLHTGVTDLLTAARLTFLSNANDRFALPGVDALYRALVTGNPSSVHNPVNPIFYVSSSAWNLHDLLSDFLDVNDLPIGPLQLQELGVDATKLLKGKGHTHKLDKARRITADYPDLPFILFGDSGQADAELYAHLAAEKPGQIKAIFIRDIDPDTASDHDANIQQHLDAATQVGVPAYLCPDSTAMAEYLIELGLLDAELLPAIRQATEKQLAVSG
jgi:phosphatidate phosphatase APP1